MTVSDMLYFDTSALLPYYREEPTSRMINALLESVEPPVLISDLSRVEFFSALARWVRMHEIEESQAGLVENAFLEDIRSGLFLSYPIKTAHYRQSERWLCSRNSSLRTLDSLHLACCLHQGAEMVTCDQLLHKAAETFGVRSRLVSFSRIDDPE